MSMVAAPSPFPRDVEVKAKGRELRVGKHYSRTCEDWLKLLLKNEKQARKGLEATYGDKASIWFNRWIVFFLVAVPTES
jgi:hypothetical protein